MLVITNMLIVFQDGDQKPCPLQATPISVNLMSHVARLAANVALFSEVPTLNFDTECACTVDECRAKRQEKIPLPGVAT